MWEHNFCVAQGPRVPHPLMLPAGRRVGCSQDEPEAGREHSGLVATDLPIAGHKLARGIPYADHGRIHWRVDQ